MLCGGRCIHVGHLMERPLKMFFSKSDRWCLSCPPPPPPRWSRIAPHSHSHYAAGLTWNCELFAAQIELTWSQQSAGLRSDHPCLLPLYISMTKHWGGLLAPPVITVGAGAQNDHHLDCRTSYSSSNPSCHCLTNPLLEFGGRLDKSAGMAQDSCYRAKPSDQSAWEMHDGNSSGGKKKNYQRYPKPPYSYLAMIAMVIQNSPEKKLTLSEVGYLHMRDAQLLSLKWLKFIRNVNEL